MNENLLIKFEDMNLIWMSRKD